MKIASFFNNLKYNDDRITTNVVLESSFTKEIRILLKESQVMREHQAPFPIIVHIIEGSIDFGVSGQVKLLEEGSIIALEANVPHNLKANQDSIVRLTLSKSDKVD